MERIGYLVLENQMVFQGELFGEPKDEIGEVVFTTAMTGYVETLTDPSYHGQIVVQTFPMIGNYGVISEDFESSFMGANAYIVKEWCHEPSNFRNEGNLDTFFKRIKKVGLSGIETRKLTKVIREHGTMNGIITEHPEQVSYKQLAKFKVEQPVREVSTRHGYEESANQCRFKVAVMDFGLKENIKRELLMRHCDLSVFPYDATYEQMMAIAPDGIMLTNGPGDPKDNQEAIEVISRLVKADIPIFGICLGHQLLALANGFQTEKMKYGHRGTNQPVQDMKTKKVYITSQNHGYAVVKNSISEDMARLSFTNVNDGTCEGIEYLQHPVFSVQFHPEACGGPKDSNFLFDQFIKMMERSQNNAPK